MAAPIPTYQRQVERRALPGLRSADPLSARDVVGELPQALAGAAQAVEQVRRREVEDIESAQLMDAYAQLGRARQDTEVWVRQQQGKAALENDVQGQAEERLSAAAGQIAGGLKSERVRQKFRQQQDQAVLGLRGAAMAHVAKEDETFKAQAYTGAVKVAADLGIQGVATAPAGQAAEAKELLSARETLLGAIGVRLRDAPAEARKAEETAQLTALHAGAVDRLLADQRGADAERYLTRWRGEMDPAVVGKLDQASKRSGQAAAAEAQAGAIVRAAAVPGYAWTDAGRAMAAVEALPDTDPSKPAVRALVEHRVQAAEAMKAKAGRDKLNEAHALLGKGATLQSQALAPIKAWMLDPQNGAAGLWDALERQAETERRVARSEALSRRALERQATADAKREADQAKAEQKARNDAARAAFEKLEPKERAAVDPDVVYPDADVPTRTALRKEGRKWGERVQKGQDVGFDAFRSQVQAKVSGMEKEDQDKVQAYLSRWYWGEKEKAPEVDPGQAAVTKAIADALTVVDVKWGTDRPRALVEDPRDIREPVAAPAPPAAPKAPAADAEARIQAEWKRRFPDRPPLTKEQVARALAAQGGQ